MLNCSFLHGVVWELDTYVPVVPVSVCLCLPCLKGRTVAFPMPGAPCSRPCEKPECCWGGGRENTPGQSEHGTGAMELGLSIPWVWDLGFSAFWMVRGEWFCLLLQIQGGTCHDEYICVSILYIYIYTHICIYGIFYMRGKVSTTINCKYFFNPVCLSPLNSKA